MDWSEEEVKKTRRTLTDGSHGYFSDRQMRGIMTCAVELAAERGGAKLELPEDFNRGYDSGAEAMRAACWEAVKGVFEDYGIIEHLYQDVKAAIEGAAP